MTMARAMDECIRCGGPTAWGRSVCKACNPAGLPEPSRSQYHATVFTTVLLVLVAIAVATILLR